jgi:DNA-binding response OmpR family regulator
MSDLKESAEYSFEKLVVAIADPDGRTATSIKYALQSQSFQNLRVCTSYQELDNLAEQSDFDVLITATEFSDGDALEMVRKMRAGGVGETPFCVVIGLADAIDEDLAKRVLDSGVDDLILKPISAAMLMSRLSRFIRGRKPFVVTSDYIGPDRRRADSGRRASARLFEVPNPVRFKIVGNGNIKNYKKSIDDTLKSMRLQRSQSVAEFVHRQIEYVMPCCLDDIISNESKTNLETLIDVSCTARDAMGGTVYASQCATFERIGELARRILSRDGKPAQDDFDGLSVMAQTIEQSILHARQFA